MRLLLHVSRPRTVSSRTPTTCVTLSPTLPPPTSSRQRTRRPSRPTLTRPSSGSTTPRRPRRRSTRRSRRSSRASQTPSCRSSTLVRAAPLAVVSLAVHPAASPVVRVASLAVRVPLARQKTVPASRRSTKRVFSCSRRSLRLSVSCFSLAFDVGLRKVRNSVY